MSVFYFVCLPVCNECDKGRMTIQQHAESKDKNLIYFFFLEIPISYKHFQSGQGISRILPQHFLS